MRLFVDRRLATSARSGPQFTDQVTALRLTRESFTTLLGELGSVMKHNFNHKVLAGMEMLLALTLTLTLTLTLGARRDGDVQGPQHRRAREAD